MSLSNKPRCVVKQFFPSALSNNHSAEAAELFRQKAERLKELGNHPQVPQLLDYFEQNGSQYIVQELINGSNLEEELAQEGAFTETQICNLSQTKPCYMRSKHSSSKKLN